MAQGQLPESLVEIMRRASEKPRGECRKIMGHVTYSDDVLSEGLVVVHIENGGTEMRFWMPRKQADPYFYVPQPGDFVQGYLDPFADIVDICGEKSQAIFDFKNLTGNSEAEAFAWFAAHPDGPPWALKK